MNGYERGTENCTHCGACTRECGFLNKYNLDLAAFADRQDLANNCFLCGTCDMICPSGISGRQIALDNRRNTIAKRGLLQAVIKNCGIYLEKRNYLFKSYPKSASESVLFFGCSFPAHYPKSTKKIAELFKAKAGIDSVFDCCGKPLEELGFDKQCRKLLNRMNNTLKQRGIKEIITLCPNCYHFLQGRLDVRVVSIYEKIQELGFELHNINEDMPVFLPCPDKKEKTILHQIEKLCRTSFKQVTCIQCCGSGGCAIKKERYLAKNFSDNLQRNAPNGVLLYCASCSGRLGSGNYNVRHFALELFGLTERPDCGNNLKNRAAFRHYNG